MKYSAMAIVALLSLSSAAWADNGIGSSLAPSPGVAPYPASVASLHPGTTRLHRGANSCALDQAKAIWGSPGVLLGYSCYYNPNGG